MAKPKTTGGEPSNPEGVDVDPQDLRIAQLEFRVTKQDDLIGELERRVTRLSAAVVALERDNPKGITASAPVPLTAAEAIVALERNSAVRFATLAEYRALGLRAGEVFEARHRFASPALLGSHIASGLRIVQAS